MSWPGRGLLKDCTHQLPPAIFEGAFVPSLSLAGWLNWKTWVHNCAKSSRYTCACSTAPEPVNLVSLHSYERNTALRESFSHCVHLRRRNLQVLVYIFDNKLKCMQICFRFYTDYLLNRFIQTQYFYVQLNLTYVALDVRWGWEQILYVA